jgi:competence protein ComEC
VKLVLDNKSVVLLPGDVDSTGFDNLLNSGFDCSAAIVVFPHHGGKPGSGNLEAFVKEFCRKTNPQIVIFSIGRGGSYINPNPQLLDLVRQELPNARIICTQLSRHCAKDLTTNNQNHLTERFARGKLNNQCCGGTIEIKLDNIENSMLPDMELHRKFISMAAPTSLCMKEMASVKHVGEGSFSQF